MGYDWHPGQWLDIDFYLWFMLIDNSSNHSDCLKCEECGKILKPGQHAEVLLLVLNVFN